MISDRQSIFFYTAVAGLLLILAISCATPINPTGGEPDRTPPVIVSTVPESGTTNFDGDRVEFTFDKFIDRPSFIQNISIEPDLAIDFDVSFRRKTARVTFEDPLPDNTTIVVKLGTEVADTDRNQMGSSFDLALSTGDVLDDGRVTGQLIDADTGETDSGFRVFLYSEPYDLTSRAIYVAQSDTSGRFEFGYIGEGTYTAFWVDDVNRNRVWDRNRELAQPFNVETFELGKSEQIDLGRLFISKPDTVAPRVEGVGLLSERRLRLRISEEVEWGPNSFFSLKDTLANEQTVAYPLYTPIDDPNVLFAQTEEPLSAEEYYTMTADGITDPAGNPLRMDFSPFLGSDDPDTTELRTISHNAGSGLFPDEPLEITYSKFIDDNAVVDSLIVVEGDEMRTDWEFVEVDRHILKIFPDETWQSGIRHQMRVWNPFEREREQIEPDIWQRSQLGSIEVSLRNSNPDVDKVLKITDVERSILVDTTFADSTVLIDNLPPLEYKIIVFEDVYGNGFWDSGSVDPYIKPEPYAIRRRVPVREGFTADVELEFPTGEIEAEELDEDQELEIDTEPDQPEN